MKVTFISDVHANWDTYTKLCEQHEHTVQVGDFGMGFERPPHRVVPYLSKNHRFIRGNHDDPAKCKAHPNYIPDGTIEILGSTKVMFIGGAWSIDRALRTEGLNWWSDEQLSYMQFQDLIDIYKDEKPDMMVTHDCPTDFARKFILGAHKPSYPSTTGSAFQVMRQIHQPKIWVFGHWHLDIDIEFEGTRFLCSKETAIYNHGTITLDL